jgi:hypothetical protein
MVVHAQLNKSAKFSLHLVALANHADIALGAKQSTQ